jgi:hypothetical protein
MFARITLIMCLTVFLAESSLVQIGIAESSTAEYLSDSHSDRILSAAQDWGELGFDIAATPTAISS